MGLYGEQVLPRVINAVCGLKTVEPLRSRVCEGLEGNVVEIGFGSGLNVPFYPAAVTGVSAVEPAGVGWKLAQTRVSESSVPVQRSGLDGQSLPFADESYDSALSTWTLCTIPDVAAALAEIRRVLKPGGTLHFLEHGLAPDEKRAPVAAPPRADAEAGLRRLSSHTPGRRHAQERGLRDHRDRRLLRGRHAEVPGRRFARDRGVALGPFGFV